MAQTAGAPPGLQLLIEIYIWYEHVRRFPRMVSHCYVRFAQRQPSKYVQIEQKYGKVRIHLRCFLTCSTPEVTLLCTTVFLRGYWRLDTRVIMYSWLHPQERQHCRSFHVQPS